MGHETGSVGSRSSPHDHSKYATPLFRPAFTAARPASTLPSHHVELASPAVETFHTWAFGRVACVGTIAWSSWFPRTGSNDHGSSTTTRSLVLPCRPSGVGGNGRISPPDGNHL